MQYLRYNTILASMDGIDEHPQRQMKKLGFEIVKSEPVPMADSWFFLVNGKIGSLPSYLEEIDGYEFD